MLYTHKLLAELEAKAARFAGYQHTFGRELAAYRAALASLGARYRSARAITAAQTGLMVDEPAGALPTAEYDTWHAQGGAGVPALRFGRTFAHHEEARAWAEGVRGVTTFAVDGSQLLPWRDASVPVALVQAGLFENPHHPPAPYTKDVAVELLTPEELVDDPGGEAANDPPDDDITEEEGRGAARLPSEHIVHLRRYQLEARTLIRRMEHHAAIANRPELAVAFLDGSLIASFALKMAPSYRAAYVATARTLLEASARCRVPLVAYIDTSYARDVVTMLRRLPIGSDTVGGLRPAGQPAPAALPQGHGVHDALLWQGELAWGDRSPAFLSARGDLLAEGYAQQKDQVAFVYFQAALDRPPARLELPRWVVEMGLLDSVMDAVRAEVIAGNGYPYPLEAADAVAVISQADRAQFYALFQQFAKRHGLAFSFSRKALSKSRRRA